LHGFFKRKRKGRRKEGMTEDNTRHTGKTEQKRAKEKEHGTAQHPLYQLTQYICIHLRPLRLVTINPTAVLWYCRLFSFNHDSSRTRWALSRRTPPPYDAWLTSLPKSLKFTSYSHCGFADTRQYSTHEYPNFSLP
jgi:hypothetical protein